MMQMYECVGRLISSILRRHKWMYVYEVEKKEFLGEKYLVEVFTGYRICEKCGLVQELEPYSGMWFDMDSKRAGILKKKVKEGMFVLKEG